MRPVLARWLAHAVSHAAVWAAAQGALAAQSAQGAPLPAPSASNGAWVAQAATGAGLETLDVLHWWTSEGERAAVDVLVQQLRAQGLEWHDAAVPGGAGVAAVKVLKGRVLAGSPPDVAQVIGRTLSDWADLGLVLPLDEVAQRGRWSQTMFPVVLQVASHKGRIIAAPLGVHRINTLLFNRPLWARLHLPAPHSWNDLERAARALRAAGVVPLAWSDEPWQLATVFESLLLGEAGPAAYGEMASARRWKAWQAASVGRALDRLRWLRQFGHADGGEPRWTELSRQLFDGQAGMQIMGDWARGELMAWGAQPGHDFGCAAVPGTEGLHLYSIDTLAMLIGEPHSEAQERMAELITQPALQLAFNKVKGSVPVRRDIDPRQLDVCARESWQTFARSRGTLVPSIAHRMAADESTKIALADVLHRFVKNPDMSAEQAQARLVSIVRTAASSLP